MHEPQPFSKFLPDDLSAEDAAFIANFTRRFSNLKDVSNLASMKMVRTLPSGGQAIVFDMGGVRKVIVRAPQVDRSEDARSDGKAKLAVPMLFSGLVEKAIVPFGEGVTLELTDVCSRRLKGYEGSGPGRVKLKRFAIEYGPKHQEFRPDSSNLLHSQYAQLRASWFSGRMAALVQVAGGYGMHDFEKLPDDPIERATMALPGKVQRAIAKELKFPLDDSDPRQPPRLPGYKGWPPKSGEIQFDYEFMETHGVAFGAGGKPWLVRVSPAGVFAMPLPMVPATTTQAFREYIAEKGDREIEWLLDTFGGMPSGEGFPAGGEAFEAWKRAGVVIKVCDVADFYSNGSGYSSAMGWSFNTSGTLAVNTCYTFGDSDGIQRGSTYMLSLSMGEAKDDGMVWGFEKPSDSVQARRLGEYLVLVHQGLGTSERDLALRYKLRRVPLSDLLARANNRMATPKQEQEYWDQFEADPIATCTGNMRRIAEGKLWAPGQPKTHPQIKFPEPWSKPQGCLSHDFGRMEGYPAPDPRPRCDTIMHAYFIGDDLKVVKYFRDDRTTEVEEENDFDECMIVGSWRQVITHTPKGLMGNFYTTDFDERELAAEHTTVTEIKGQDLGFDTAPFYGLDGWPMMCGTLWRNRYFQHDTHTEVSEGYGMVVATCVPYLAPHAVLHAWKWNTSGARVTDSRQVYFIRDPNSYRYFTYDFVWAWFGCDSSGNMATATKVEPYPRDGEPFWLVGYNYNPGPCTDFADEGDWMGGLPQDITHIAHKDPKNWEYGANGGGRPTVKNFSKTTQEEGDKGGDLRISLDPLPQTVHKEVPNWHYFEMSPDEYGNVFYRDAIRNEAGNAVYSSVSEPESEGSPLRKHWGHTSLADHKSAHHFIGVIHE